MLQIVNATIEDAPGLVDIFYQSMQKTMHKKPPELIELIREADIWDMQAHIQKAIEGQQQIKKAREAKDLAFVRYHYNDNFKEMCLSSAHAIPGKGAGTALIEAVLDEAKNIGATKIVLNALPDIRNYYQTKFGFKDTPSVERFEDGEPRFSYPMHLNLA